MGAEQEESSSDCTPSRGAGAGRGAGGPSEALHLVPLPMKIKRAVPLHQWFLTGGMSLPRGAVRAALPTPHARGPGGMERSGPGCLWPSPRRLSLHPGFLVPLQAPCPQLPLELLLKL